jgi:hypothetical protein
MTKGVKSWLFLTVSKCLKTKAALVEVSLSAASAEIRQNPKTSTKPQFRASVKLRLFFFTAMLVQRT